MVFNCLLERDHRDMTRKNVPNSTGAFKHEGKFLLDLFLQALDES